MTNNWVDTMPTIQLKNPQNRKYYKGRCSGCGEFTEMTFTGYNKAEGKLQLRCRNCRGLNFYPIKRALKSGRLLTEKEFEERDKALAEIRDYTPQQTYWRGQKIRHKKFNDVGEVIKKEKTEGNHQVIIVKFARVGEKKLVQAAQGE